MTEMVERVARAICEASGAIWGGPRGENDPGFMLPKMAYMKMARAAIEAAQEWQPIETAPKTGARVLCWNSKWPAPESGCLYGIYWAANSLAADKGGWKYQPTHWMPLPEPPQDHQPHADAP